MIAICQRELTQMNNGRPTSLVPVPVPPTGTGNEDLIFLRGVHRRQAQCHSRFQFEEVIASGVWM